jgi:hypothetical protein
MEFTSEIDETGDFEVFRLLRFFPSSTSSSPPLIFRLRFAFL